MNEIGTEADFARWYNEVEGDLLESSYEEYQYAEQLYTDIIDPDEEWH